MTQEIIVYRNPLEQQLWHAAGDGSLFPIIAAMIVSGFAVVIFTRIAEKVVPYKYRDIGSLAAMVLGVAAGLATLLWLWI